MALYKRNPHTDPGAPADEFEQDLPAAADAAPPDGGYEVVLVDEHKPLKPRKRRNLKRMLIVGVLGLVALLVAGSLIANSLRGPAPTPVQTQEVVRGNIVQTMSTSGILTTGEKVTVFSPVTAPLASVNAQVGKRVHAGDTLFTFNTTDLERQVQTAQAQSTLTGLQGQEAANKSGKAAQNAADAQASVDNMKANRGAEQQRLAELQRQYEEFMAQNSAAITTMQQQKTTLQTQMEGLPPGDAERVNLSNQIAAIDAQLGPLLAQQQSLTGAIAASTEELARINALISQMEGIRDTAQASVLDQNQQAQLAAQGVAPAITLETARENLRLAQAGVAAPISGVITQMDLVTGAPATQYGVLCTIESLAKVNLRISLSRYDLERVAEGQSAVVTSLGKEYTGRVTQINAMATTEATASGSSTFVSALVALDNPGGEVTLGIEADVKINTGQRSDVLTVPISAVNTDVDGTFVFVAENGVAVRRPVTPGISSDNDVEIVDGLAEGDKVILSSQSITEGQAVADMGGAALGGALGDASGAIGGGPVNVTVV